MTQIYYNDEALFSGIVSVLRGTEWAATGKVTQEIPDDFQLKLNLIAALFN